jgi:hypothetical protein
MSRAGFPTDSLSPPQTYETMQGKRDSPVLQERNETGTGRSGPNSPTNQGNIPHLMNTKGTLQGNVCNKPYSKNIWWVFVNLLSRF